MSDLRVIEAETIRAFVQSAADEGLLSGRVLDYGCGKQPYRDLVEATGGEYLPFDREHFPGNVSGEDVGPALTGALGLVDTILSTQVLQYVDHPRDMIWHWRSILRNPLGEPEGHLVITYPTNWPEVEPVDLWRFTKLGMTKLLEAAEFTIIRHDWRHGFRHEGISFTVGYGVIARA